MGKAPIQILLGSWGEAQVSLEPTAKVAFSAKQTAYRRSTFWGDSF